MRRRTPSEIKAYGDGYAEAYKEFCHLLKNHDVNKAMRKMKIFADAVALTVETATDEDADRKDEPQTCSVNGRPYSECADCEYFKCTADETRTNYVLSKDSEAYKINKRMEVEEMWLNEQSGKE